MNTSVNIFFSSSRWQGPLSIAVYAPSTDFQKAVDSILYYRFLPIPVLLFYVFIVLSVVAVVVVVVVVVVVDVIVVIIILKRECVESTLVKDFVTFHVFFDFYHTPEQVYLSTGSPSLIIV